MDAAIDFQHLAETIDAGAAVCLLGAGFSVLAKQAGGIDAVPDTPQLTDLIKKLLDIPSSEPLSLADAAELAEEEDSDRLKLNQLLTQTLTSTIPSDDQKWIINKNWRAIFTTNFDDIIEVASSGANRVPITPASNISAIPASRTPIYYLHGRALDLLESDKKPSFVISESNYLKLNARNRALYARLFNEIICSRAVILIGYSLKDLEIASQFLGNSASLREKTFIVTHPDESEFALRRLRKFGNILPIGLAGISDELRSIPQSPNKDDLGFQYLREFSLDHHPVEDDGITGDDFLASVITGHLVAEKFAAQKSGDDTPYCVERSAALRAVLGGTQQRYIASSDFGNGKTAFLEQLAVNLFSNGRRVFFVDTRLPDLFPEIDRALAPGTPIAFLIDDVVRYRPIAAYIGNRLHGQAMLLCTTRGDQDAQYEQIASEMGGSHRFIDLNLLNDQEVDDWNHLLERWGYWELKAGLSEEERRLFIVENCGRENRSLILSLFDQSRVAKRIDDIVSFFLKTKPEHVEAFCGLLISSLAQRHVSWDSLVTWLNITEDYLRRDIAKDDITFLFARGRGWNFLTSAQLAEYILKHKFVAEERDVLVDVYAKIVLSTAESADDVRYGYDFRENLKELMKFRFLEKLFGETDASGVLIGRVYRKLSEARRIRGNPQFWLQYAMSRMKVGDLENAESFINTAMGRAEERGLDYNPYQIIDQRARLYFQKNSVDGRLVSRNEVNKAIEDLIDLAKNQSFDIVYTMRSLPIIESFLEMKIDDVELGTRDKIKSFIILLREKTSGFDRLPRSKRGETKVLRSALSSIELILFNA